MNLKKCYIVLALVASLLILGPSSSANNSSDAKAEQDRLQNAGKVMREIVKVLITFLKI